MEKGINTIIQEAKQEVAYVVNKYLKQGLPISVMGLIVDNVAYEIINGIKSTIEEETKAAEQPIGQVEWRDEDNSTNEVEASED